MTSNRYSPYGTTGTTKFDEEISNGVTISFPTGENTLVGDAAQDQGNGNIGAEILAGMTAVSAQPNLMTGKGYKTRLCRSFTMKGSCPNSDNCTFAHGGTEVKGFRTRMCKFEAGKCPQGETCSFAHSGQEVRGFKTRMCKFEPGKCPAGDRCSFAHGPTELQARQTAASSYPSEMLGTDGAMFGADGVSHLFAEQQSSALFAAGDLATLQVHLAQQQAVQAALAGSALAGTNMQISDPATAAALAAGGWPGLAGQDMNSVAAMGMDLNTLAVLQQVLGMQQGGVADTCTNFATTDPAVAAATLSGCSAATLAGGDSATALGVSNAAALGGMCNPTTLGVGNTATLTASVATMPAGGCGGCVGGMTGNLTGSLTGNLTGTLTGNVTSGLASGLTSGLTSGLSSGVTGSLTSGMIGGLTGGLTGGLPGGLAALPGGLTALPGGLTPLPSGLTAGCSGGGVAGGCASPGGGGVRLSGRPGGGFKTRLCTYFVDRGMCPSGASCTFAHSTSEIHGWKTRLCRFAADPSSCPQGDKCSFAHSATELRVPS